MRIANPFIMITHVIGSLREADVGWQSADTIKLNFRFGRAQRRGPLCLDRQHDRLRPKSANRRHRRLPRYERSRQLRRPYFF